MTTLIVCAILLAIICVVEIFCIAARYEKLKPNTTMRRIFYQDMRSLLKWIANTWFKLVAVVLFTILICVLQIKLGGIKSELHKIYCHMEPLYCLYSDK